MSRMMSCSDRCCGACPACIGNDAYDDGREREYAVTFKRGQSQTIYVEAADEDQAIKYAEAMLAEGDWESDDMEIETEEME